MISDRYGGTRRHEQVRSAEGRSTEAETRKNAIYTTHDLYLTRQARTHGTGADRRLPKRAKRTRNGHTPAARAVLAIHRALPTNRRRLEPAAANGFVCVEHDSVLYRAQRGFRKFCES